MKITDIMTLILFVVFVGCVGVLVVLWYSGSLDYETSAAPRVFAGINNLVGRNPFVIYGLIILVVVIIAVLLVLRLVKRMNREEINVRVMGEMESKVIPRGKNNL